jgi:hypothetical protein
VWKQPHRRQAFCVVVGLGLQRLTLVARAAARRRAVSGRPLIGLPPHRRPDDRPKTAARRPVFRHGTVTPGILAEPPAAIVIRPVHRRPTRVLERRGLEASMDHVASLSRPRDARDSSSCPVHPAKERNVS